MSFCVPKPSVRTLLYITMAISLMAMLSKYYASDMGLSVMFYKDSSSLPPRVFRQKERHMVLEMGCNATSTLRANDSMEYLIKRRRLLRNIIVNDDYKLLYCQIPKVSSTQWKKVMGVLAGTLPNVPLEQIPGGDAHERGIHRLLSDFSAREIRHRLDTYTSFLFVRHPLERLVSGYQNKFGKADVNAYFPQRYAADIKARYGSRNATRDENGTGKYVPERVTFGEFARWVSDPNPAAGARNEHWAPMVDQCHPCSIPYTVIGKMETLEDDAHYVLRTAKITSIAFPEGFHSKTRTIAGEMLASLPASVLRRVLRLYFEDFVAFGYHPSEIFAENRTAGISSQILFNSMFLRAA